MSRKILFYGIGFNENGEDAEVEIKLDGETLYSGVISTDTTQGLTFSRAETISEGVIAEWIAPSEAGSYALSMTAVKGDFLYTDSRTTYNDDESLTDPTMVEVRYVEDEETGFIVSDPNENIKIDGVGVEDDLGRPENRNSLFGQWDIPVREGTVMTCTYVIDAGKDIPEVSGTININTATFDELRSLHGVDSIRAADIIDGRTWENIDDLSNISGISQEMIDGWDITV